jgi:hypothetical protein
LIAALQTRLLHYPAPMTMTWMATSQFIELLTVAGLQRASSHDGPAYSRDWYDAWYLAHRD